MSFCLVGWGMFIVTLVNLTDISVISSKKHKNFQFFLKNLYKTVYFCMDKTDQLYKLMADRLAEMLSRDGMTQQKLGRIAGCSQQHINELRNKGNFKGLGLERCLRLYPELLVPMIATLSKGNTQVEANGTQAIAANNSTVTQTIGDRSETLRAKIVMDMLDLSLPEGVLTQVLTVIKKAKV